MDLIRRTRPERIWIAPGHFLRLLRIGQDQLPFLLRLRVAAKLTWILVRTP